MESPAAPESAFGLIIETLLRAVARRAGEGIFLWICRGYPGTGPFTIRLCNRLTHVLAKELGPKGITVNAVAPGPVPTDLFLNGKSDDLVARIKAMNPFGRFGTPKDIARVVTFLASDQAAWISGQVIRANGGVI